MRKGEEGEVKMKGNGKEVEVKKRNAMQ